MPEDLATCYITGALIGSEICDLMNKISMATGGIPMPDSSHFSDSIEKEIAVPLINRANKIFTKLNSTQCLSKAERKEATENFGETLNAIDEMPKNELKVEDLVMIYLDLQDVMSH
jgi:hypothetical protein